MTGPVELLSDCEADGIRLLPASDGGLTIDAPRGALTPALIGRLKANKPGLLALLRGESVCQSTCRCGSIETINVPIHAGQSVRRDCARCGRFVGFSVWYGREQRE